MSADDGTGSTVSVEGDPWRSVIGQPMAVDRMRSAVERPVHAYLFVGPRGSGTRRAAGVFAGELLAARASSPAAAARDRDLARREQHPDIYVLEPEGRGLLVEEASRLVVEASRSPIEGSLKVIVCDRFHAAEPAVAPKLLKTIEEPPPTTVFVLLAEEVPAEQVTIASRCLQIDFRSLSAEVIARALVDEGVAGAVADEVAQAAAGDLDRARLLATDPRFLARRDAWRSVPDRLDGTGAAVAVAVDELRALIDEAQEPLVARHADETAELDRVEAERGTRGSGRKTLEQRQRRELRLLRDDELRFGLATLAAAYRDQLVAGADPDAMASRMARISAAGPALIRNPNEALLLHALLVDL